MAVIKGQREHEKFKAGDRLTRRQAMLALCYECNGFEDSNEDCGSKACPIYQFHPHRGKKKLMKAVLDGINSDKELAESSKSRS